MQLEVVLIYFHLLGEPLCHPDLEAFLSLAEEMEFKVIITTNGTLIEKCRDILLKSNSHYKTVISLHSFEANDNKISFEKYLDDCFSYAKDAENKKISGKRYRRRVQSAAGSVSAAV